MPSVKTKYFGTLSCAAESIFYFPHGLPGFEDEKAFVVIEEPERAPLVFLQSIQRADLCFLALPILTVDKSYRLAIAPEDLDTLGLEARRQPFLGTEAAVLVMICLHDNLLPTANLMAPIVLNLKSRLGVQAIRHDGVYSHDHPIGPETAAESAAEQVC